MKARSLTERLSVSPQVHPAEIAAVAARFRLLVNNRPDGEEPGQPTSAKLASEAERAGLAYLHIPVVPGQYRDDQAEIFADAVSQSAGPVLAFCRTGTRSASLWALSQAGKLSPGEIIGTAEGAGYDLSGLAERLKRPPPQ